MKKKDEAVELFSITTDACELFEGKSMDMFRQFLKCSDSFYVHTTIDSQIEFTFFGKDKTNQNT